MTEYGADDIKKLEYPLSVQMRSNMYLGGAAKDENSPGQKNVCIREILDNSVTENLKGKANHITLKFHKDGSVSCLDNGRGLPVDTNKQTGENGIIMTMGEMHSGGNFVNDANGKVGPGLNGVGAACCNAMCSRFSVYVYRGKTCYHLSFKDGKPGHFADEKDIESFDVNAKFTPSTEIEAFRSSHERGTYIRWAFNDTYFAEQENIIVDDIIDRCRYTVYIVPGLAIDIIDETRDPELGGGEYSFKSEDGVKEMIDFISTGEAVTSGTGDEYAKKGIYEIETEAHYKVKSISVEDGVAVSREETRKIPIQVAFRFNNSDTTDIRSFANTIATVNNGIHKQAFEEAMMEVFGKAASKE